MRVDTVVLGCGWAGVLLSYSLSAKGASVLCVEKSGKLGGLLRTEHVDGFTVDVGGSHVIFSKDTELLRTMLGLVNNEVVEHSRKSFVKLAQYLVPYPFENGLYVLPAEERYEALSSFLEALFSAHGGEGPRNLEEWITGSFGKWIADKYMIPYNKKLWKRPLSEIDVDWLGIPGRLPIPDWREVVKSAVGIPSTGYREQAKFYYPVRGGIQSLYKAVYSRAVEQGAVVLVSTPVHSVRKRGGLLVVNNWIEAKVVYSTIPVPDLLRSLGEEIARELPFDAWKLAELFDYNKVVTVAVGLRKPAPDQHWVYVPDESAVFHRYAWLSNYSPFNAPEGHSLVLAEITVPKDIAVGDDIAERAVRDFQEMGLFSEDEVVFSRMWMFEHGYPIHRVGLSRAREQVVSEMRKHNIILAGRWGTWRYLNMDMVLREVRSITGG